MRTPFASTKPSSSFRHGEDACPEAASGAGWLAVGPPQEVAAIATRTNPNRLLRIISLSTSLAHNFPYLPAHFGSPIESRILSLSPDSTRRWEVSAYSPEW